MRNILPGRVCSMGLPAVVATAIVLTSPRVDAVGCDDPETNWDSAGTYHCEFLENCECTVEFGIPISVLACDEAAPCQADPLSCNHDSVSFPCPADGDFALYVEDCWGGACAWEASCACIPLMCGDGQIEFGEECDDGNFDDTDGCTHFCDTARCGDGFVWAGVEQCDDGNGVAGDGCSEACVVEEPAGGDGDADTDADVDADADADADTDGDSDVDSDTDVDTDSDADVDGDADADVDTDSDADVDGDADADVDGDADADVDGDADADSDADGDDGGGRRGGCDCGTGRSIPDGPAALASLVVLLGMLLRRRGTST